METAAPELKVALEAVAPLPTTTTPNKDTELPGPVTVRSPVAAAAVPITILRGVTVAPSLIDAVPLEAKPPPIMSVPLTVTAEPAPLTLRLPNEDAPEPATICPAE